jgi:signal transduction histidine kinase
MRWPLRLQIMLPMSLVMLVLLAGVSVLNAYLSVQRTKSQIQQQLSDVARTLTDSSFPLTDAVLVRMKGLSGADFLLADRQGAAIAASRAEPAWRALAGQLRTDAAEEISLAVPTSVGDGRFYHAVMQLRPPHTGNQPLLLHILYPEHTYTEALRQAVFPPLIVGGGALLLVMLIGIVVASRVTHPLRQLGTQVHKIAQGDFRAVPLPRRDDEVRDLAVSVNEMAQMLTRYEDSVRRNEQLRTVDQLGAGIAHQMRNAATGCRMALDLHRRECSASEESETIDVATRQLSLMEKYLRRFLTIGRKEQRPAAQVNLTELIDNVLPLVRPAAAHVGVQLQWQPPRSSVDVHGNAEDLEQVIVNLLLNAIEAAAQNASPTSPAHVGIAVDPTDSQQVLVRITDSGAGPAQHVRDEIFEPLVTEKPDGTGLGLPVAREILAQHGGTISWQRDGDTTCFYLSLPRQQPEPTHVETVSR